MSLLYFYSTSLHFVTFEFYFTPLVVFEKKKKKIYIYFAFICIKRRDLVIYVFLLSILTFFFRQAQFSIYKLLAKYRYLKQKSFGILIHSCCKFFKSTFNCLFFVMYFCCSFDRTFCSFL